MSKSSTTGGQNRFASIPAANIQRSAFDRSCGLKTTFDSGYLVPIFCDEALPGDTMSLRMSSLARMATPIHPFMDNLYMDTHFFAVPIRLIWENWARFNGEQTSPGDSTDFLVPEIFEIVAENTLSDYMGIPTATQNPLGFSALWHRAYNLIYNEWFRDENLQDPVTINRGDGPDLSTDYELLRRGKRHDYFSSCLPFPQKGPSVALSLGTTAPVIGDTTTLGTTDRPSFDFLGSSPPATARHLRNDGGNTDLRLDGQVVQISDGSWSVTGGTGLITDLSAATASTINDIREAFQIQRLYERDARGGTRLTEIIKSHFHVTSPDARLQRPEYLGGGSAHVNVNPVAQTSETDGSPQANLAAFATASTDGHGFRHSFTEHCIVIGLVSVRGDLNYQQGLNRMFSRRTRFDFYWPALAHLGEQAVLNKEIFADAIGADDEVFGYQERFAEYRYKPSMITGSFRSNAAAPLDSWHLAQDFASLPVLDATFIEETPPVARIIAVTSEPEFLLDAFFTFKHVRPMPTYSVPGMVDHF